MGTATSGSVRTHLHRGASRRQAARAMKTEARHHRRGNRRGELPDGRLGEAVSTSRDASRLALTELADVGLSGSHPARNAAGDVGLRRRLEVDHGESSADPGGLMRWLPERGRLTRQPVFSGLLIHLSLPKKSGVLR